MAKNLVIFAHGFLGFKEKLGIRYWNGAVEYVQERLDKNLTRVKATEVEPAEGTKTRVRSLARQVEEFLNQDPRIENIHIIAHSMGGLDARRLATPDDTVYKVLAERKTTITTISTPHKGSPLADFGYYLLRPSKKGLKSPLPERQKMEQVALKLGVPVGWLEEAMKWLQDNVEYLKTLFGLEWPGFKELTTWGVPQFKNSRRVKYFSYCGEAWPPWPFSIKGDYLPTVSVPGWLLIYCKEGENDGSVSLKSGKWGKYKGTIPADHAEQIGFQFSLLDKHKFRYKEFYLEVVKDLCNKGEPTEVHEILSRI
ncbi:MAG: esterase/lipase family protein [Candidatus Brocadiales bacterium]